MRLRVSVISYWGRGRVIDTDFRAGPCLQTGTHTPVCTRSTCQSAGGLERGQALLQEDVRDWSQRMGGV